MAPLNPNTTPRFWLDYDDGLYGHTLLVRWDSVATTIGAVMTSVNNYLLAIADALYTINITGARQAAAGAHVSTPVTWTGGSTFGGGTMPGVFAPRQFCFLGRDLGGRRVRFFQYAMDFSTPDNYRFPRAAGNIVDDALTVIEAGQAAGIWLTIEGGVPAMYQYADINFNNYYEAKVRG